MDDHQSTAAFLREQCIRWPGLMPQDLLKALHQSVFGCGHLLADHAGGLSRLREEMRYAAVGRGPWAELLDGDFCRVSLGYLRQRGMAPETVMELFALSAEVPSGSEEEMEEKLAVLLDIAEELPFSREEMEQAVEAFRQEGFPVCRHSEMFRTLYAPAYRVIRREYLWIIPLLAAIDRRRGEKRRLVVALEGGSASGKTTLAALLQRIYGCTVFHMDDFFLRPEQRTEERLAEPGGNVDRERFAAEVLAPLAEGRSVQLVRYDCHSQSLCLPEEVSPTALTIVEGAYSMHPALAGAYDLTAFLKISPELQRQRVLLRNGPEWGERFFSTWIPMEQRYFAAMDPMGRSDILLEVQA